MFTARYGLIPYIKQINFNLLKVNTLNTKLNSIFHLLALLGAHPILHVSMIRVKLVEKRERLIFKILLTFSNKQH